MAHPTPINLDEMPQWMQQAKRGTDWGILIVIMFSLLMAWVFFTPSHLSQMNNSMPLALRTAETSQALREGRLYPRWSPFANDGYGAPVLNFDPPAVRYIAATLDILFTNDVIQAIQWVYVFAFIVAGVSVYLLVIEFYHRTAGLLTSLFYVSAPYIAFQIPHIDGDLPQLMALALLPTVLWSLTRIIKHQQAADIVFAVLSLTLLILTSPLHSMTIFLLMMPILIHERNNLTRESLVLCALAVALAIGLTSFYWLPAIVELQSLHWIIPSPELNKPATNLRLFAPIYRLDRASLLPEAQLTLGIAISLSLIVLCFALWRTKYKRTFSLFWLSIALYGLIVYLLILPSMSFFLGIITFCFVMAISYLGNILSSLRLWLRLGIWLILIGTTAILTLPIWSNASPISAIHAFNSTQEILKRENPSSFLGNVAYDSPHPIISLAVSPITIDTLQNNPSWRIHSAKNVQANFISEQSHLSQFQINTGVDAHIIFNRTYYAGWQATLDGNLLKTVEDSQTGLVRIELPDNSEGVLTLRFGTTPTRIFSWIVCFISFSLFVTVVIWQGQRKHDYLVDNSPLIPHPDAFAILGLAGLLLTALNIPQADDWLVPLRLPANAQFDAASVVRINSSTGLRLNGFTLLDDTQRGNSIDVVLYWTLNRSINSDIRTRLHLTNSSNDVIYASSAIQVPASYPPHLWVVGGYVRDNHKLTIPKTLPDGRYSIAVELLECKDACVPTGSFTNISGITLANPLPLQNITIQGNSS